MGVFHEEGFGLAPLRKLVAAGPNPELLPPHKNRDPLTDNCLDCGASREEIDDYALSCKPVTGPNRVALVAMTREQRRREREIDFLRKELERGERNIVSLSRQIREKEAEARELTESINRLNNGGT
jgi:hypothetical protein